MGKGNLDEEIIRLWQSRYDSSQPSLNQSGGAGTEGAQTVEGLALLCEKVRSIPHSELLSYVTKCAHSGGDATPVFMQAIFQGVLLYLFSLLICAIYLFSLLISLRTACQWRDNRGGKVAASRSVGASYLVDHVWSA